MQTEVFQNVVKHLTDDQTPRVWSLLVTVFGELAQKEESRISGSLLRHIIEQIGIKPEAMRVAIHRLRKDGWIDSERSGRNSAYFLTEWGREQSAQASPRIYASVPAADRAWLVMSNPGRPTPIDDPTGAWISSNVLITSVLPETAQTFVTALSVDSDLPDWMTSKLCDDETVRMSQEFAAALSAVQSCLGPSVQLSIIEVAALRVLLVHSWRRIVLKAPVLPDYVFPEGWCGSVCRDRFSALLAQNPKPGLDALEEANAFRSDITA